MNRTCLAMLALAVSGCAASDPYQRHDVWYPTGANAGNIAAMAVRPTDLIAGRDGLKGDARQAAGAIDRVWLGRTKPLPVVTSSAALPSSASATPTLGPN